MHSVASGALDNNVVQRGEQIGDIGADGPLFVGLQVAAFGFDDFVERFGHVAVERRDEPGLEAGPVFLNFFGIQVEVLPAERTHSHKFDVTLEVVPPHGHLIEPEFPQNPAPAGDAHVAVDLATVLQVVHSEHVVLQVFGIGMHGAELVDGERFPVLADALQADDEAVCGVHVVVRVADFSDGVPGEAVDFTVFERFEAAGDQASECFGQRNDAVFAFGDAEVEPFCDAELGEQALDDEVGQVVRVAQGSGVLADQAGAELLGGFDAADVGAAGEQGAVDRLEVLVKEAGVVDFAVADQPLRHLALQTVGRVVVGLQEVDGVASVVIQELRDETVFRKGEASVGWFICPTPELCRNLKIFFNRFF